METIPTFALYGESQNRNESFLHWETITSRSRLYGFHIAPHRHENLFQILFLNSGNASLEIDGSGYRLSGPALVAVPPLTVHGYRFSEDVTGLVLTFYDRDIRAVASEIPEMSEFFDKPRVLSQLEYGGTGQALAHDIDRIAHEADRQAPGYIAGLRAHLTLLLLAIWRAGRTGSTGYSADNRAQTLARTYQMLVDQDFRTTRTLDDYAGRLGISATHLNRICRRIFGTTALTVVERRIMLEARRYLQFSRLSIKEIALLLGYDDPAYFTRAFTRHAGVSPTQFRSQSI